MSPIELRTLVDPEIGAVLREIIYQDRFDKKITAQTIGKETQYCKNGINSILNQLEHQKIIKMKKIKGVSGFEPKYEIKFNPKKIKEYVNKDYIDSLIYTNKQSCKILNKKFDKAKLMKEIKPIIKFFNSKMYNTFFLNELSALDFHSLDKTIVIPIRLFEVFEKITPNSNKSDYLLLEKASELDKQLFPRRNKMNLIKELYFTSSLKEDIATTKWIKQRGN